MTSIRNIQSVNRRTALLLGAGAAAVTMTRGRSVFAQAKSRTAIVVGAGIAGLTAAYDLQKAGYKVVVLDKDNIPGGRMADRIDNGICTHTGASIIFSFNKVMFDLIKELEIENDVTPGFSTLSDEPTLVDNGTAQYGLKLTANPAFLLSHPQFSISTKARLTMLLPDMIRSGFQTDPCLMHTAIAFDDESTSAYVTRTVSKEFLEDYVEPYFRAPWHWEPEDISKAYFISIMGHATSGDMMSFYQGIGHLTRVLATKVDVRLGNTVESIEVSDSGCNVRVVKNSEQEKLSADIVVCAVPGTQVTSLIPGLNPQDKAFFGKVRYNRGSRLYYALSEPLADKSVWFTRNSPSKFSLVASNPDDPLVPKGFKQPPYLQFELTPQVSEEIEKLGAQRSIDSHLRDEVYRHFPEAKGKITSVAEQWWDDMLTLWYTGYARDMAAFLERTDKQKSRLYFCGDYLSQSHTGGACASGRRTAGLVTKHWA